MCLIFFLKKSLHGVVATLNRNVGKLDRDKLEGFSSKLTEVLKNHSDRRSSLSSGLKPQGQVQADYAHEVISQSYTKITSLASKSYGSAQFHGSHNDLSYVNNSYSTTSKTRTTKFETYIKKLTPGGHKSERYSNGSSDSDAKKSDTKVKRRKSRSDKIRTKVNIVENIDKEPF